MRINKQKQSKKKPLKLDFKLRGNLCKNSKDEFITAITSLLEDIAA